ncbi:PIR protein [Plasmodium ovale]|uniref:PIR Superfamily Protein n=2 Tax=Plasmodium ovale TaxID=36330 RepID=A0A1A8WDP4_PLAOA|nr:PIR Superfamily Protein [Plasmodium ovale curtisi]SBT83880.1 PIR protein [Plasmodium ovale]
MYGFCSNSPYYQMVIEKEKKEVVQKIEDTCETFSSNVCSFENSSDKDICENFFYMYKYLHEYYDTQVSQSTLTNEDFDFLNYWLNVKLKGENSNALICIDKFNKKIKDEIENIISGIKKLEKDLHVIDPSNLENMEILYELYNTKQKIIDIMFDMDNKEDKKVLCKNYTEICYNKYVEGMNKCLYGYDDFYKVLKLFERDYKYLIEDVIDESGKCKSNDLFQLPEKDPVIESKERRIMTIKILSTPLILLFVIPLLYKYTPFGPFLRTKINMLRSRWMNLDNNRDELLLSSTDIEDNISDQGEYNISYYSGTS